MDTKQEAFASMLDGGVQDAYKRQWHRIERGLRLNRLRLYIETIAPEYKMTDKEKKTLFLFFQKSLDDKLLNTLKVVQYDPEKQQITGIKGFEIERNADGVLKFNLPAKKMKTESAKLVKSVTTRKKKVVV